MKFYWNDMVRMIRHLSALKIVNAGLLFISFFISKWLNKPMIWAKPISVSFEPTTACNLKCPECPSGLRSFTRPEGNLKSDFFRNTIDEMHSSLTTLLFYFQGEPYINPYFLDMVGYAESKKIYTITSTNGHFLSDENINKTLDSGLSRLIISIDGTTQDTYEQYRIGGNLNKVIDGTRRLIQARSKRKQSYPHVIFQYLVVRPNEHQIPEVYKLAKEIGVDEVRLKTAQVYDYEQGNDLIPLNPKYSRYQAHATGNYSIKNKLLNQCWRMWQACVITWDGLVVPCCFDKDASHRLGDLKKNTMAEIWTGDKYQSFRATLLRSRKEIDICKNCTEGGKVFA